ncbi:hypothetical protein [Fluviicola chungangensis]|uniref:Lipoprotein n=1 Tax=Fluviicola chungangensis TaxID=2597671 RepID=A0A556N291_9FLAO|nr:hypothetical protein [Fluviicola chungangensis]TSJ46307.1 hypothetical protein FO442_03890 [Fluviicola chungangensis]
MKNMLPLIVLLLILAACKDPSVKYNQVIQNDSDYDVWIKVYERTDSAATVSFTVDSFFVASKGETIILERNGHKNMDQFKPCKMYVDSISGRAADTLLVLDLNLNSDSNYVFNEVDRNKKGGGTCECRAVFKNIHLH